MCPFPPGSPPVVVKCVRVPQGVLQIRFGLAPSRCSDPASRDGARRQELRALELAAQHWRLLDVSFAPGPSSVEGGARDVLCSAPQGCQNLEKTPQDRPPSPEAGEGRGAGDVDPTGVRGPTTEGEGGQGDAWDAHEPAQGLPQAVAEQKVQGLPLSGVATSPGPVDSGNVQEGNQAPDGHGNNPHGDRQESHPLPQPLYAAHRLDQEQRHQVQRTWRTRGGHDASQRDNDE
mmetsp:Transcript_51982/g.105893  ORF Transcript_51982/g.105893 Transcript_51982/m.105893 type:complete len:232 (+) Transcript_51982:1411-2106(+)